MDRTLEFIGILYFVPLYDVHFMGFFIPVNLLQINLTLSNMHLTRKWITAFFSKRSKTDRYNHGVYIRFCRTHIYLCFINHLHVCIKHRA